MDRRKRLALVAAIMGSFVAGLDATAVNVALPAIRGDLGGGLAGQQWVSNAYLLALGSLILVGGSLGDVFGERRVFSIGVAGFGVMSLLCAIAPSIGVLIACRALQGAFGALLMPSALAVIVAAFPRNERGSAIGSWTAWSGIATVVGPLAGGYLVDAVSWRLIFAVNVPFVVATLVLVSRGVPARERGLAHARVDWLGAALTFVGLAGPVLALIRQPVVGWSSPQVWIPGLGGPALLGVFLIHERRAPAPMLPLELFRRRNFTIGNVQTFAMYGGLGITFFLLVLYLQEVAGYRALQAGLALLPSTVVMFLLSKRVGRLADRVGPRLFMGLGPLTAAVGLALMLRLHAHVSYLTDLLPALLVFSLGLACTVAPLTAAVLSDADESDAGIASGVNNAIARVAGLLAIAAVGAVISAQFNSTLNRDLAGVRLSPAAQAAIGQARRQTLTRADPARAGPRVSDAVQSASVHAFHVGIGISTTLVAVGGLLGLAGIRNPRRVVRCEDCPGGQLAGQPLDVGRRHEATPTPQPVVAGVRQSA
ncbi:MAG: DHA2 family efflux MFS transporter permease subunit [Solirubrobacterales bacterium]|nr:DHA2 family efflux MFS transporter permease subunit [Solirubrobacterales bacterium]MBV9473314.1 DHA2 family efflux MFS transporter permease subunit [Solirubrobacterales bacterium]